MPFEIKFDKPPAGYVWETASGSEDQHVKVVVREFTSSEDGELFLSRLEGLPSRILNMLPADPLIRPSSVDHLVAVVYPDGRAMVYT